MPPSRMTALTVHLPFVGFTFTQHSCLSDNPPCLEGGRDAAALADNARLAAEVQTLRSQIATKAITETASKSADCEYPPPPPPPFLSILTHPLAAEVAAKVRTLERAGKALKSERSQLQEELSVAREQQAGRDKELRETKSSLRENQDELTRLSDKSAPPPPLLL